PAPTPLGAAMSHRDTVRSAVPPHDGAAGRGAPGPEGRTGRRGGIGLVRPGRDRGTLPHWVPPVATCRRPLGWGRRGRRRRLVACHPHDWTVEAHPAGGPEPDRV